MKLAFFGTPVFAANVLRELSSLHEIVLVVSTPDKKRGRGKKLRQSPVKELAVDLSLELCEPQILDDEFTSRLRDSNADLAVVVAYGKLIPDFVLSVPKYGFVNVHASILPRWRGAAPIHRAILAGDDKSGISIMKMDAGLDTGDVYSMASLDIVPNETTASLESRLNSLGISELSKVLEDIAEGSAKALPQSECGVSYAHKIEKDMAFIDWNSKYEELSRLVRGLNPYPCAKTYFNGDLIKIYCVSKVNVAEKIPAESFLKANCGSILYAGDEGIYVRCADGVLSIDELQMAGSNRMSAADFLRGKALKSGDVFE